MKIEVIYGSRGGNTRKVAEAIAGQVGTAAKSAKGLTSLEDECQLLFIGSGIYVGRPAKEISILLEKMQPPAGMKAAVFGTYGSETKAIEKIQAALETKGVEVLGTWGCPGKFWAIFRRGRPNDADIAAARTFAEEILNKAQRQV